MATALGSGGKISSHHYRLLEEQKPKVVVLA
jgi:hypothetical protein